MGALLILALVAIALILSVRDGKILDLRRDAREGLTALKFGIADVERQIARICNSNSTGAQQQPDANAGQHDCGCTPEKLEDVCKDARTLVDEAKAEYDQQNDRIELVKSNVAGLTELVKNIRATALKVSQARRVLLAKPADGNCDKKKN